MAPRYETLAIGALWVDGEPTFDVRLVRDQQGAFYFFIGTERSGPYATEREARAGVAGMRGAVLRPDLSIVVGEDTCASCGAPVAPLTMRTQPVCAPCAAEVVDEDGAPVAVTHEDFGGGVRAIRIADGARVPSDRLVLRGRRCRAIEGRFGGVFVVLD